MSDKRLRELERAWQQSGSLDDQLAYLQAALRAGVMTTERLELAAFLGDEGSWRAMGKPAQRFRFKPPREIKRLFLDLRSWGTETWVRGFLAGIEHVLPELGVALEQKAGIEAALQAARRWAQDPTPDHAEQSAAAAHAIESGLPRAIGATFRDSPSSGKQCSQLLAWRVAMWASRGEHGDPVELAEAVEWVPGLSEATLVRQICSDLIPSALNTTHAAPAVDEDQLAWTRHYEAKRKGTLEAFRRGSFEACVFEALGRADDLVEALTPWGKSASVAVAVLAAESVLPAWDRLLPQVRRPHLAVEAARRWLACPCHEHAVAARPYAQEVGSLERQTEFEQIQDPTLQFGYFVLSEAPRYAAKAAAAKQDRYAASAARQGLFCTESFAASLPAAQAAVQLEGFKVALHEWLTAHVDPDLLARAKAQPDLACLEPNPSTATRDRQITVHRCLRRKLIFYQPQGWYQGSGFLHALPVMRALPISAAPAAHGAMAVLMFEYSGSTGHSVRDAERVPLDAVTAIAQEQRASARLLGTSLHLQDGVRARDLERWTRQRGGFWSPEGSSRKVRTGAGDEALGRAMLEALGVELGAEGGADTSKAKKTGKAKKSAGAAKKTGKAKTGKAKKSAGAAKKTGKAKTGKAKKGKAKTGKAKTGKAKKPAGTAKKAGKVRTKAGETKKLRKKPAR